MSLGKNTIEFNFKSDEDLNRAAIFISKNGVDVFHQECNNEIKKIVANEKNHLLQELRLHKLFAKRFQEMEDIL